MDNRLKIIKEITTAVVGVSVSSTVKNVIDGTAVVDSKFGRVKLAIGALVLGSMMADYASTWADEKFVTIHDQTSDFVKSVREKSSEQ